MGSNDQGITQSPFANPVVPTPSATEGDQGIGGDLDMGAGANGLQQTPWANPIVPTPSGTVESGPFGNPSRFSSVDGSTRKGESHQGDITTNMPSADVSRK